MNNKRNNKQSFPNDLFYLYKFIQRNTGWTFLFDWNKLLLKSKTDIYRNIEEKDIKWAIKSKRALNIFLKKTLKNLFLSTEKIFNFININWEEDTITPRYHYFYAFIEIEKALLRAKNKEKLLRDILTSFRVKYIRDWYRETIRKGKNIAHLRKFFDVEDGVDYSAGKLLSLFNKPEWFDKKPVKYYNHKEKATVIKEKNKERTKNKKLLFEEVQMIFQNKE